MADRNVQVSEYCRRGLPVERTADRHRRRRADPRIGRARLRLVSVIISATDGAPLQRDEENPRQVSSGTEPGRVFSVSIPGYSCRCGTPTSRRRAHSSTHDKAVSTLAQPPVPSTSREPRCADVGESPHPPSSPRQTLSRRDIRGAPLAGLRNLALVADDLRRLRSNAFFSVSKNSDRNKHQACSYRRADRVSLHRH